MLTCCFRADMSFNKDKKKKLANLLAKRRTAAAGVGTSTPRTPPTSATSALNTNVPAPVDDRQKGVVVVDSDTCTGLVYKKQRVGEAVVPSPSASGGLTQVSEITPRAPPLRATLLFTKVGRRVPLKVSKYLPLPSSLCCFSKSSSASKTRKCWRA